MAIAQVGSAVESFFAPATTSPVMTLPSGLSAGHQLIYSAVTETNHAAGTPPSGHNIVGSVQNMSTDASLCVYQYEVTGSEGSSITLTDFFAATERGHIICTAWSGVDSTTPVEASTQGASAGSSATSMSASSITPSDDDRMFVMFTGCDPSSSAYSGSPDSSPVATELFDGKSTGDRAYTHVQHYLQGTAAALGLDVTSLTGDRYGYLQLTLKPAAGSSYTIAADAGSYAITGQAASLERGLRVDAEAGSYAVTGQAASLLKASRVSAEAGSYLLTGQDASLNVSILISAEGGSYAIAGTEANLLKLSSLPAGVGAYVLTGSDATLTKGGDLTLVCESGAYVITGTEVSLSVDVPLPTGRSSTRQGSIANKTRAFSVSGVTRVGKFTSKTRRGAF